MQLLSMSFLLLGASVFAQSCYPAGTPVDTAPVAPAVESPVNPPVNTSAPVSNPTPIINSVAPATPPVNGSYPTAQSGYCSVLDENFASGEINRQIWRHEFDLSGCGNGEFQMYTDSPANSFIQNSTLYLKPTLNPDQEIMTGTVDFGANCTSGFNGCKKTASGSNIINPISSAKLTTVNSITINRGKVEVVAKLPAGDWLWPAIWLLPKNYVYGAWPRSGEIDIMESFGNKDQPNYGPTQFGSTLHWGPSGALNSFLKTRNDSAKGQVDYSADFHTYGMVWTKESIITYIDDPANVILNVPTVDFFTKGAYPPGTENPWASGSPAAPFDQEFYLILNLAVGGTSGYFPEGQSKPWLNSSPTAALDFYNARNQWFPTWSSPSDPNSSALAIKSVKMWKEC